MAEVDLDIDPQRSMSESVFSAGESKKDLKHKDLVEGIEDITIEKDPIKTSLDFELNSSWDIGE